jgi:hypothetical protein
MPMTGGAEDEKREMGEMLGGILGEKQWAGAGSRICQPGGLCGLQAPQLQ